MVETTFTDLEALVFNKALEIAHGECEANVKELALELDLNVDTVKGVVGSLVKKKKLVAEKEERNFNPITGKDKIFLCLYPVFGPEDDDEFFGTFGCDYRTLEEQMKYKISSRN